MKTGVLCLTMVLLLTGCGRGLPQGWEMDDTALMRTMGVDTEEGTRERMVTASTARRAKGLQGEGQPPLILSARRPSLSGACLAMQQQSDSYVFFGHVDQLLFGEELARAGGVQEVLEYFSREEQLGLGTQVWLVRGDTARNAIDTGTEKGVNDRLNSLREDEEMGLAAVTRTAGEVLSDLLEDGSAYLPALTLTRREGETTLQESGYGVLKGKSLVGWLTGEEARGLELLQEHPGGQILELDGAAVRLDTAMLTCLPVLEDGTLTGLELDVRLSASVVEGQEEVESRKVLEEMVERKMQGRGQVVLACLQRWNADCLSLKRLAGAACPGQWNTIRNQWEDRFPTLEIRVRCTAMVTGLEE